MSDALFGAGAAITGSARHCHPGRSTALACRFSIGRRGYCAVPNAARRMPISSWAGSAG